MKLSEPKPLASFPFRYPPKLTNMPTMNHIQSHSPESVAFNGLKFDVKTLMSPFVLKKCSNVTAEKTLDT